MLLGRSLTRCAAALVVLASGVLVATPSAGAVDKPSAQPSQASASRAVRFTDVPMPMPAAPGSFTKAVYARRSMPGYTSPAGIQARLFAGSGDLTTHYRLSVPAGGKMLWGDWWGRGVQTPAVYAGGRWQFYATAFGPRRKADATVYYGGPGDRPVVGDFDGNGRTDLAVVRGRKWFVTTRPGIVMGQVSHPASTRHFAFGTPEAQPVAGDWDGTGPDGVAMFLKGHWSLRQVAAASSPITTLQFGFPAPHTYQPGDLAVAGDWNGNGHDQLGLVRGSTWRLRGEDPSHPAIETRTITRPDRSLPSAMPVASGPNFQACPTARAGLTRPNVTVVPSGLLGLTTDVDDPATADVLAGFQDAQRYLLDHQYEDKWAGARTSRFADVVASDPDMELAIRPGAMSAAAIAVALATGAYDADAVGRTSQEAERYVDWLVRSIACQHASVSPGGWGDGFQTAHWATLIGMAAWLTWDDLTPQTRAYVEHMLIAESDDVAARPLSYWTDPAGAVLAARKGDTAAEEVAWNSNVLELTADMMPAFHSAAGYRAAAVQLDAAAYASISDITSPEVVNGVALDARLQGANILDDGTLVNHKRIHPDYMGNIEHLWWSADLASLAGRSVPEAAFHNADLVYGALSTVTFTPNAASASGLGGAYVAPGGTIYRPDGTDPGAIYYPEDDDWGTSQRAAYVSLDAHAAAYGLDSDAAWPASEALQAHVDAQLDLVASSGIDDGRTFDVDPDVAVGQFKYAGREEYAALEMSMAWLALYVRAHTTTTVDDGTYPVPTVDRSPAPPARPAAVRHQGLFEGP